MNPHIQQYIEFTKAYWGEIVANLQGPLKDRMTPLLPEIYSRSGNVLVFPAKDGLVGVFFERGFQFPEPQFKSWLADHKEFSPFVSVVTNPVQSGLSILQLMQIFSGNSIKVRYPNGHLSKDIFVSGFPRFPGADVVDPKTNKRSTAVLMQIDQPNKDEFGLSLRDFQLHEQETGRLIKPFWWRQLDVFDNAYLSRLNTTDAKLSASREIVAQLAGRNLGVPLSETISDPFNPITERLTGILSEFQTLLESSVKEAALQKFLESNPFLLAPDQVRCIPHPQLGAEFEPDFILLRPNADKGECVLVEIEPAEVELFTKAGDITQRVNHALRQVSDWRAWLRQHVAYARESLGLENIHCDSPALVVVGRSNNMSEKERQRLQALNLERHGQTTVITYDELAQRLRALVDNLRKEGSRFRK